jgi:hypothetical protein
MPATTRAAAHRLVVSRLCPANDMAAHITADTLISELWPEWTPEAIADDLTEHRTPSLIAVAVQVYRSVQPFPRLSERQRRTIAAEKLQTLAIGARAE